jgi:hypothetical protein
MSNGVFVARRLQAPPPGAADGPVNPPVLGKIDGCVVRGYDRSGHQIMSLELDKDR